jgi:hypothetical protein
MSKSEKRQRTNLVAVRFRTDELAYVRQIARGRPIGRVIRDMTLYGCPHDPFETLASDTPSALADPRGTNEGTGGRDAERDAAPVPAAGKQDVL